MKDWLEVGGALTAGVAGVYLAFQRYLVVRSKDETTKASETAITAQFKVLQDALEANRKEAEQARRETADLRAEFSRMDRTIHSQQRTITRMEMLLRQFAGLVQESGIVIPKYMQDELTILVLDEGKGEIERRARPRHE